jgi:hypothetical protein
MSYFRNAAALLVVAGGISIAVPVMAQHGRSESESRLKATIDRAIHADGPFFEPSERALIERKCGYAPGTWDGNNISMSNGILTCSNGRRVDDREVRAMMEVAGQRISRRVSAVMEQPEIRAVIAAVAEEASAKALAELGSHRRERRRDR